MANTHFIGNIELVFLIIHEVCSAFAETLIQYYYDAVVRGAGLERVEFRVNYVIRGLMIAITVWLGLISLFELDEITSNKLIIPTKLSFVIITIISSVFCTRQLLTFISNSAI